MKIIEGSTDTEDLGFRELRENSDKVIAEVAKGKSFLVKRKSKALFRIVPVEQEVWETAIDFTRIDDKGVLVGNVLQAIDELKTDNRAKYGRPNKKVSG